MSDKAYLDCVTSDLPLAWKVAVKVDIHSTLFKLDTDAEVSGVSKIIFRY